MQRLSYPGNRFCVKELCKHMKIETSGMENKMIMLYWLRCSWRLKRYKNSEAKETDFPRIYTTWWGGGGGSGSPSVTAFSRKIFQVMVKW